MRLHRAQGRPRRGGSRTIQRGAASPRFGKLHCQGNMPGSVPGMQETPQNLPRTCECGGAGSHCAKHDLAGNAGGENCFDVVSGSWNYSLVGSYSGGDLHHWEKLRDRHTTGRYRVDTACLLALAMCHLRLHHPAYCMTSLLSARRGSFSPSSSSAKQFVQQHLLISPHLVLA